MIHLITGYAGKEHITSADQASFNASVFGVGSYVFNKGSKLKASVDTATSVTIADGDLILNGRHIRITGTETVYFDSGTAGLKRIDLIAVRYTQELNTGVESAELKVIKGVPSVNPSAPDADSGDFVLYSVTFNGFVLESIEQKFEIIMSNVDLFRNLQFALASHEYVLKAEDWEGHATGKYEGCYTQEKTANVGSQNFLTSSRPIFLLNEDEAASVSGGYINAEVYFSMLNMDVAETDGVFHYTFFIKRQKPPVDIPVIVRGV